MSRVEVACVARQVNDEGLFEEFLTHERPTQSVSPGEVNTGFVSELCQMAIKTHSNIASYRRTSRSTVEGRIDWWELS